MSNYFKRKDELTKKAREHTEEMRVKYKQEIKHSVASTTIYGPDEVVFDDELKTPTENIILCDLTSGDAIEYYVEEGKRTAVLNFASYRNPGGRFIDGSSAQEECLCHESFLYNVLLHFPDYYMWNNKNKKYSLYTDRAMYTKDILFRDKIKCDVLTCAAPNPGSALKFHPKFVTKKDCENTMRERIKFVLDVAVANKVDVLILGAFGCGAFRNEPEYVAKYFHEFLKNHHFEKVIFAIPRSVNNINYHTFKKEFEEDLE